MAVLKTVISSALVEPNKDVSRSQSSHSANIAVLDVLVAVLSSLTVDVEMSDWWRKIKSNCMLRGVVLFLRVRHC